MPKSQIIFLNGTSSSGKGSIASALLEILPAPYVHVGFDDFINIKRSPAYYGEQGFRLLEENDGTRTHYRMEIGPIGARFFAGKHRAIAALAEAGNNLIIDEVLWERDWLHDYVAQLHVYNVLFVGVHCPLVVVEERERGRGDRLIGLARSQFDAVHTHGMYDLTLDTSAMRPMKCAEQIVSFLASSKRSKAFAQLYGDGKLGHAMPTASQPVA
jgi:chloramphenicol 3-O phosphotransferase